MFEQILLLILPISYLALIFAYLKWFFYKPKKDSQEIKRMMLLLAESDRPLLKFKNNQRITVKECCKFKLH